MCPREEYSNRVPRPEVSSQSPSSIEVTNHHIPFMHHAEDQILDEDTQRAAQELIEFQTNSQEEQKGAESECKFGVCCNLTCPGGPKKCWHKSRRKCPFFRHFDRSGKALKDGEGKDQEARERIRFCIEDSLGVETVGQD
jgi:hypothetical protein